MWNLFCSDVFETYLFYRRKIRQREKPAFYISELTYTAVLFWHGTIPKQQPVLEWADSAPSPRTIMTGLIDCLLVF